MFRKRAFDVNHVRNVRPLGELIEKSRLPGDPETAATLLLTLLHQVTCILSKQINATEEKFLKEDG